MKLWSSVVSFALNPQYWTPILRTEPLQPMRIGNCKLTISINYSPPLITITQKQQQQKIITIKKSQNFNFILEKNLFNKKVVFLHKNKSFFFQNIF